MTTINNVGTTQYTQPYTGYAPQQPSTAYAGAQTAGYAADGYQASPYATGYNQGVGATAGAANTMVGLSSGVGSMANSLGGIFGTIINLITNILNTIANMVGKLIEGALGLFGIGKKDKAQGAGDAGAMNMNTMPLPGNQGMGVATPAGTPVPPPPPGTDINAAYNVVAGDLGGIQDPNQGIQIINIHAQKARDYRDKAEQFAKEAEKESREAAYAAEALQKNPSNSAKLAELQSHKSKAMDLLKTAQEYTKAVYDEALYAQAANDVLGSKFGPAVTNTGTPQVTDAWKNWIGGTTEKKFLIFNSTVKAAPETFMQSMNAVNANIGRATQVIAQMSPVAR